MKISKYGLNLVLLDESKIELVRNWRNDPKISQHMEFRDFITSDMQKQWFDKINNTSNYYFIIEYENRDIGLINIKDIDYVTLEGEAGIFIYDDTCLNSTLPFQACFCLYDFCFETLGLNNVIAHILKGNKNAIKFNKMIGYTLTSGQENLTNQIYVLKKQNYLLAKNEFSTLLTNI